MRIESQHDARIIGVIDPVTIYHGLRSSSRKTRDAVGHQIKNNESVRPMIERNKIKIKASEGRREAEREGGERRMKRAKRPNASRGADALFLIRNAIPLWLAGRRRGRTECNVYIHEQMAALTNE